MKPIIFALFLLCLALTAGAQTNQQPQQTDSTPAPGQWVRLNSGTTANLSHVDYVTKDTIWVDGYNRSTNGGITWPSVSRPGGEGFFQSSTEGITIGGGSTCYVTHDAAQTWDTVNTQMQLIAAVSWASPDTCFVVGNSEVSRSTDGGMTWLHMGIGASNLHAVSFCNSKVGYAVGDEEEGPLPTQFGGACYKTVDGGVHWNQVFTGLTNNLYSVVSFNPDTIIVAGAGPGTSGNPGLFRSSDGGATWKSVFLSTTKGGGGIVSRGNQGFFVGGVAGSGGFILHTMDAGLTWSEEESGVMSGYLNSVAMLNDTDVIAVGTNGTILKRPTGSSGVAQQGHPDSLLIQIFPNPSQQLLTFQYVLPSSQAVSLIVFDANGHLIATLLQGVIQSAGTQSIPISTANLSTGQYYYQFSAGQLSSNGSFTVIHV